METTKKCTKCGENKSTKDFPKRKDSKDGLRNSCFDCQKEYRKKKGKVIRESVDSQTCNKCSMEKPSEEFYKEKLGKNGLRSTCKTCDLKQDKDYYDNNKNIILERKQKYILSNKKKISERARKYNLINRKKQTQQTMDRYRKDQEFRFNRILTMHLRTVSKRTEFKSKWDEVKDIYNMYGIIYHIDHLIPRTWFKSSTPKTLINDIDNLQIIDEMYNLNKGNRWADEVPTDYLMKILPYIKEEYIDQLTK
jgi:hypothetical protein